MLVSEKAGRDDFGQPVGAAGRGGGPAVFPGVVSWRRAQRELQSLLGQAVANETAHSPG
jgi:hypothetical protein